MYLKGQVYKPIKYICNVYVGKLNETFELRCKILFNLVEEMECFIA